MGKRSRQESIERNDKSSRYRWEFLRRNEDFKKECNKIIDSTKASLQISPINRKEFDEAFDQVFQATIDFSKRWGIAFVRGDYYPSPIKCYEDLSPQEQSMFLECPTVPSARLMNSVFEAYARDGYIARSMFSGVDGIKGTILDPNNDEGIWDNVSPTVVRLKPNTKITEATIRKIAQRNFKKIQAILYEAQYKTELKEFPIRDGSILESITVKIDLNFHTTRIIRELTDILNAMKNLRRDRKVGTSGNPQYEAYPDMLAVYDIWRENTDMTFAQIHRKWKNLSPKDVVTTNDENKTRMIVQRAKELVTSFYRKI